VLAAGPIAGFVVYAVHAPLDWDWEMPAVTLVAIVLAGALLAMGEICSERPRGAQRARLREASTPSPAGSAPSFAGVNSAGAPGASD